MDDLKRLGISSRKEEAALYELVAAEIDDGIIIRGLWLKALAETNGNEQIAKAKYCQLRVQSLRDDEELLRQVIAERQNMQEKQNSRGMSASEMTEIVGKSTPDAEGIGSRFLKALLLVFVIFAALLGILIFIAAAVSQES